jgi:hypothetical protein
MCGQGVGWRGKGRHSQLFQCFNFTCFFRKAHCLTAGQQKQVAFFRQRHKLVGARLGKLVPSAAYHEQVRVIVYISILVGDKESGLYA